MGGFGSGRQSTTEKKLVSEKRFLDVRYWQREGMLKSGAAGHWYWSWGGECLASLDYQTGLDIVSLTYSIMERSRVWRRVEQQITVEWSDCHFGGKRAWFGCPVCLRRVAILYGGELLSCRKCQSLVYESQYETEFYRSLRQADKLRTRLGWDSGVMMGVGSKPKWMRWSTFSKLCAKHEDVAGGSFAYLQQHKDRLHILQKDWMN